VSPKAFKVARPFVLNARRLGRVLSKFRYKVNACRFDPRLNAFHFLGFVKQAVGFVLFYFKRNPHNAIPDIQTIQDSDSRHAAVAF